MRDKVGNGNIEINISQYPGVAMNAKLHNISFKQLVDILLKKFQSSEGMIDYSSLQLPSRLEKLGECLADVEDSDDEKLNYLLERYK